MHEQPVLTQIADEAASRRALLKAAFGVGTTMLLTGCGAPESGPAPNQTDASTETTDEPTAKPNQNPEHNLTGSDDEQLQLLAKREKQLGRQFSELMVFLPMPADEASAAESATETAGKLKEFADRGVKPYLVFEPDSSEDASDPHAKPFQQFLAGLQNEGVTGEQMGTVVVYPEANSPLWNEKIVEPATYKKNVNALNSAVKEAFPDAKTGVLLNSTTYDNDWNGTKQAGALLEYVDGLHDIDEVCLQGFPWSNDTLDPTKFLDANVALALGARLGGPKKVGIRFNTGSYNTQINPDTHKNATMTLQQRTDTLVSIMKQAIVVKDHGYETTMQVFGENKAREEADWSYDQSPAATDLLKQFFGAADKAGIQATIFG